MSGTRKLKKGRPREFDPGEAVTAARDTFWARGYKNVSVGDLETATGVVRTSLYNVFGSKRGLFDAALDDYLDGLFGAIDRLLVEASSGLDDIRSFFDDLKINFDRGTPGCLMVNSMVEFDDTDNKVSQRGTTYIEKLKSAFSSALERAGSLGELQAHVNVEESADLFVLVTLGLNLVARFGTEPEHLNSLFAAAHGSVTVIAHPDSSR